MKEDLAKEMLADITFLCRQLGLLEHYQDSNKIEAIEKKYKIDRFGNSPAKFNLKAFK